MKEHRYKNLEGRKKLIDKLVHGYINASASQATVVLGNHGSGKSYVLFEVINGIHSRNRRDNKLQIYIAEGDKLSLYENSSKNSLDNIGTTISFAGNPKINANRITPSRPSKSAKGSRKLVHIVSIDELPTYTLDNIYIIIPAGIATTTALPNTYKVLSIILLIITFIYWGFRYGGSSNINDDGIPFKIVLDNILDIIKVIDTEKHITNTSNNALNNEEVKVLFNPTKNIVIIAIIISRIVAMSFCEPRSWV